MSCNERSCRKRVRSPSKWGGVAGFAYVVADAADLIAHDAEIGAFPALLAVVYMIAIVVGTIRYR